MCIFSIDTPLICSAILSISVQKLLIFVISVTGPGRPAQEFPNIVIAEIREKSEKTQRNFTAEITAAIAEVAGLAFTESKDNKSL